MVCHSALFILRHSFEALFASFWAIIGPIIAYYVAHVMLYDVILALFKGKIAQFGGVLDDEKDGQTTIYRLRQGF